MLQAIDLYITEQWLVANKAMVCSIQNVMLLAYNFPYRPVIVSHQVDALAVRRYAGAREGIVNAFIGFSPHSRTNARLLVSQRYDFLEPPPILMVAVQPHRLSRNMQRLIGIRAERVTIKGSFDVAIDILQVIHQRLPRIVVSMDKGIFTYLLHSRGYHHGLQDSVSISVIRKCHISDCLQRIGKDDAGQPAIIGKGIFPDMLQRRRQN